MLQKQTFIITNCAKIIFNLSRLLRTSVGGVHSFRKRPHLAIPNSFRTYRLSNTTTCATTIKFRVWFAILPEPGKEEQKFRHHLLSCHWGDSFAPSEHTTPRHVEQAHQSVDQSRSRRYTRTNYTTKVLLGGTTTSTSEPEHFSVWAGFLYTPTHPKVTHSYRPSA